VQDIFGQRYSRCVVLAKAATLSPEIIATLLAVVGNVVDSYTDPRMGAPADTALGVADTLEIEEMDHPLPSPYRHTLPLVPPERSMTPSSARICDLVAQHQFQTRGHSGDVPRTMELCRESANQTRIRGQNCWFRQADNGLENFLRWGSREGLGVSPIHSLSVAPSASPWAWLARRRQLEEKISEEHTTSIWAAWKSLQLRWLKEMEMDFPIQAQERRCQEESAAYLQG